MTASTHHDTELVLDDAVPTILATREFDAPVARVFQAHTDPQLYAQWVGPHGFTTEIGDWECRTGGSWAYRQTDPDGETYDFYGSFHEVREDELVVQTFAFAGYPDGVVLERITFTELGEGHSRVASLALVDSFDARDAMIAMGMESGVREGYVKLDGLFDATIVRP